ncbi:MAG: hypothetical protein [Caudoviricetes sp.]|nr:MAG: hypothetical protein [Caudoviricetes sp.]
MVADPLDYLHLVLVPVAESYRGKWRDSSPFSILRQGDRIRVKFLDDTKDKKWQTFCNECNLEQDISLEY